MIQVYILEEVLSALLTPFILMFALPKRSLAIVDFFRHHTVDVIGVGDVCAFAQMDIRKHGNPQVKYLSVKFVKSLISLVIIHTLSGCAHHNITAAHSFGVSCCQ